MAALIATMQPTARHLLNHPPTTRRNTSQLSHPREAGRYPERRARVISGISRSSVVDAVVRTNDGYAVRCGIVDGGHALQCEVAILVDPEYRHVR